MCIRDRLGGAATIFGPLLGSILFFVVRLLLTSLAGEFIPSSLLNTQQTEPLAWVLIGLALILLVVFSCLLYTSRCV